MTWRNRTAAVALAAVLVGGCSASAHHDNAVSGRPVTSTPTPVTQAAARGVEAAISTIPWTQVGPGWLLATWSQVPGRRPGGDLSPGEPTPATATTMLYLVDPAGGRYPITSFPPPGAGPSPTIADWSGDGTHALFYANAPAPSGTYTVTTVDLRSGAQASFTIDNGANSFDVAARYSRPQGKAILLPSQTAPRLTGSSELTSPAGQSSPTRWAETFRGRTSPHPTGPSWCSAWRPGWH
jgi:TolB protein